MATIRNLLDFEKPLHELEEQVEELKRFTAAQGIDRSQEIAALESQLRAVTQRIYSQLAPWDKVQLARHPARPYTLDFIRMIFDDFLELHGDRTYGDDPAIVGGLAVLNGEPVMVIGHQKGRDIKERSLRNFGSARPEGYRRPSASSSWRRNPAGPWSPSSIPRQPIAASAPRSGSARQLRAA